MYYFDQQQPALPFPMPAKPKGAVHASEMAYIFKHFDPNTLHQRTEGDHKLSEIMVSYWTNFAKNGDPNHEGLPEWPNYKEEEPTVMYLKSEPHTGPVCDLDKLKILDEYYVWRRTEKEGK